MRLHTSVNLGPNRELTKEGFTLFRNVSVSRIGEYIYGPDEGTGIEPGPDGLIHIMRTAEEVFKPGALDSGNGKSLVISHPDDDVVPDNWRDLTHGFMFNMRRGTGDQVDEAVADILVTTPEALEEIDLGLREVSLGYDADYYETGPGRGEQRNYYLNHVALIEAGRCGSRCAVRDHAHHTGECEMKTRWQRVLDAISSKDEEKIKKAVEEARDEESEAEEEEKAKKKSAEDKAKDEKEEEFKKETKDSIAKLTATLDALAKSAKDKAKDEEEEEAKRVAEKKKEEDEESEEELEEETGKKEARKAKDSALLSESFESVKMNAEIIAPGVQIPTFDAAADPKKTFRDCVCGLRRKALQQATADADTAAIITTVRGRSLDSAELLKLSCGQVRTIFNGVAAMKKVANNGKLTVDRTQQQQQKTEDNLNPTQKFIAAAKAMRDKNKK